MSAFQPAASGNSIFARARTIATMTMTDANQSVVIDSLGGLRALLNNVIRQVYRTKAKDARFLRDIVRQNTIPIIDGVGQCPDFIIREYLKQAQWQDMNNSLITYYDYNIDQSSGVNYGQLGYVVMVGNTFAYTEPAPGDSTSYNDDLFVTTACFPTFPASMADDIEFPSDATIDDIVLALSMAITGKELFATA